MSEIYFNELSIENVDFSVDKLYCVSDILQYLKTFGITTCRIGISEYNQIQEFLQNVYDSRARNLLLGFYSLLQPPFESDSERDNVFLEHEWKYGEKKCLGLALAYIWETFSLSYFGAVEWDSDILEISKDEKICEVKNFCNSEHKKNFQVDLESLGDVELIESSVAGEKSIHLRDDHGNDILYSFAKKVCRCVYVDGVINSMEWKSNCRRFIYDISRSGIVEIVLPWTDQGLGIVVKTTGRNLRETQKIADILEREYGKL